jgi:hypothetical protein
MRLSLVLVLVLGLGVVACTQQEAIDKLVPHPESEYAQNVLKQLHERQFDQVEKAFAPELRNTPGLDATLGKMADEFPPGEIVSTKVVGTYMMSRVSSGKPQRTTYNLTYEYQFPKSLALANVVLVRSGDKLEIAGMHVQRETQSLAQRNTFTLSGKPVSYWLIAALVAALPLFCFASFIVCLRTPIRRRKWLWAVATLLGVVTFSFNWSTGEFGIQLISIQLLSASAVARLYSPWILSISFPLGAVMFWINRKRLRQEALAANTEPPPLSGPTSQDQVQTERHEDGAGKTIDPA